MLMHAGRAGEYSLLNPLRNSLPAPLPIFDVSLSKRNVAFLMRQQQRRAFTAHAAGGPYDTRYLLHAFRYTCVLIAAPTTRATSSTRYLLHAFRYICELTAAPTTRATSYM